MVSIRTRTSLVLLPILVATVFTSTNLSLLSTRRVMTTIAMRSLAYKAEEIERYANTQWEVLAANNLSGNPDYEAIAMRAVAEYALLMVRTSTERILALDANGEVAVSTSDAPLDATEHDELRRAAAAETRGWLTFRSGGRDHVGHGFAFEPFAWYVVVSEDREAFFGAPRLLTLQTLVLAAITVVVAGALGLYFAGVLTRPLHRMAEVIREIGTEGDLTRTVTPEYDDEVGLLASEFNRMISRLAVVTEQARQSAQREREARLEGTSRESETLEVLGRATDYRDPETGAHVVRVGLLAELLARRMGAAGENQILLRHAAPLHDIGKIGIPDSLLLKPSTLDPEEMERMRAHTRIGWEILSGSLSKFLLAGAEIARSHHERWDGTGYPEGLAGERIPLVGRIVGVVDVFDSLISARPYKKAWTREEAFAFVERNAGAAFDPLLATAFMSMREDVVRILDSHRD